MSAYTFLIGHGMPEGLSDREQDQWAYQWMKVKEDRIDNAEGINATLTAENAKLRGLLEERCIDEYGDYLKCQLCQAFDLYGHLQHADDCLLKEKA